MSDAVRQARNDPVCVARLEVIRADGTREAPLYSTPDLPWWHLARRLKLRRHLRLMRREDAT